MRHRSISGEGPSEILIEAIRRSDWPRAKRVR